MKAGRILFVFSLTLLTVLMVGGCAKPNKDFLYGIFTNKDISPQKMVRAPGEMKDYCSIEDTVPTAEGTEQIVDYWRDSEGNVFFKTQATEYGIKFLTLQRISKSGTVLEFVANGVADFASKEFPTEVDPTGDFYHIYYRAKDSLWVDTERTPPIQFNLGRS